MTRKKSIILTLVKKEKTKNTPKRPKNKPRTQQEAPVCPDP